MIGLNWKIANLDKDYVVSFDMFDTLIHRNMALPEDLFKKIQKDIEESGEHEDFYKKRIEAEKRARGEEITLEDIYKAYNKGSLDIKLLKTIEIKNEICSIFPDKKIHKIWEQCLRDGRKVIITTDMYLPRSVLVKILEACGYNGYSKLYISSEWNARKRTGCLFKRVMENEGTKVFHIGDNFKSDYIMPKANGLKAYWLPIPDIKRRVLRIFRK